MENIEKLSDAGAVKALSLVVADWSKRRGLEALMVVSQTQQNAIASLQKSPPWAGGKPDATPDAGRFARKMLVALADGSDDEVAAWTNTAVKAQFDAVAYVDPLTLSIIGAMVIGGILAARVKKIGAVEFYEGVPKELADVLKVGAQVAAPGA
jgi:hypothetical protein